jgi:integrase
MSPKRPTRPAASAAEPRICEIGSYWLSKHPERPGPDGNWYRTWYDKRRRQTRRVSLGTPDLAVAGPALAEWVVLNGERSSADPRDVLIDEILLLYWRKHAESLPSAETAKRDLACWQEYWEGDTVAALTPDGQEAFRAWLPAREGARGLAAGGVDRILSTGRAALNWAVKNQKLDRAPFVFMLQDAEDRRSRDPMGRPIGPADMAKLFDAAQSRHLFMYLLFGCCTMARPEAIVDCTADQADLEHDRLKLNPDGRRQTTKHRPIVPIAPALKPWLTGTAGPTGHFVTYRRKRIRSIYASFRRARIAAGLPADVTPYSLRHGMARELRKRKVPLEEIQLMLGHLPQGSEATTSIYAPFEPDYCESAVAAIDAVMAEVRGHLQRAKLDRPGNVVGMDALMPVDMTGRAWRHGVGEAKRQEVRRLILAGVPHKEVVARTGVSGGTVSVIRQDLKANLHLYRNSEAGPCVSSAYHAGPEPERDQKQPRRNLGGPGRIRTCDNTVMSGGEETGPPQGSSIVEMKSRRSSS